MINCESHSTFSKYNEELGFAASYLLSSIGKAEDPKAKKKGSDRRKSTIKPPASKDVADSGKNQQLQSPSVEDKRRKSSEGEPKWQTGVPRPRLL